MELRDLESKLGRRAPESLIRSLSGGAGGGTAETPGKGTPGAGAGADRPAGELELLLRGKLSSLRQQMAHLRALDLQVMQQLLSINEGLESVRCELQEAEPGGGASSLTGSFCSLSDSQGASPHSSCSDGLDEISVGSYLDTLGEEELEHSGVKEEEEEERRRVEEPQYYCFT